MTREEAIEIVKEFINGTCLHLVDREALETLIPELLENEDEKVRQAIVSLVQWAEYFSASGVTREDVETMLAWLEKQKENTEIDQKPTEWNDDIIQKAVKEVGLTQHQIDWFKTNVFPPKQEWSEGDEKMMKDIDLALRNLYDASTRLRIETWLKSLHSSWKPTEEQLEALDEYIYAKYPDTEKYDKTILSLREELKKQR